MFSICEHRYDVWDTRCSTGLYRGCLERDSYLTARQGVQGLKPLAVASRLAFADDANLEQINATTQPSKGSIIFDFGGPGNINFDSFAGSNGQALLL